MKPRASVVVPAYRANRTLADCVRGILAQDLDEPFEVIVVASADDPDELPHLDEHPRLTLITHVPRLTPGQARNRGVAAATGCALAFTDASVLVPRSWLRSLLEASADGSRVVGGAVRNANPSSAASTVEYLVEFVDLHPRRPARTAWHGAGCNLLFPRSLWDRYGPWPDLRAGEDTLLTGRARADGVYLFAGEAGVCRIGRTRMRDVIAHQFVIGRYAAHLGRIGPHKLRPLVRYTPLAPLAAVGRVLSIYARVAAWMRADLPRCVLLLPFVVLSLAAWGAGLLIEGVRLDRRRGA